MPRSQGRPKSLVPRTRSARALSLVLALGALGAWPLACASTPPSPAASVPSREAPLADAGTPHARACVAWHTAASAPTAPPDESAPARRATPEHAQDRCETADSNLATAEQAILALDRADTSADAVRAWPPWDHKSAPEHGQAVARRFAFTRAESAALRDRGFVVLSRVPSTTFAFGLHEVYQSQLPLYVSADAILHAVYASNDRLIADIEAGLLRDRLGRALSAMHCALAASGDTYPLDISRDIDIYLTVARSLLADEAVPSVLGTDAEVSALVGAAKAGAALAQVDLFGRSRLIDWTQLTPRGHYADPAPSADATNATEGGPARPRLAPFFRAAMWLARLEWNLVSRSSRSSQQGALDPRETPREAIDALAVADLAERAGALPDLDAIDRAWTLLAGRREDVSIADLLRLKKKAGIARVDLGAFDALKAAIGNDFERTARTHPMAEGAKNLPAIATLLGPRVTADAAAFRPLIHTEVNGRYLPAAGDVAYVLGLDRGKAALADDFAKFPALGAQLEAARGVLGTAKDAGDLYGAWLGALRGVAATPRGVVPSFMKTTAYDDLRMNTLVVGYGQLRHNYALMAAQAYDEGGCEIPDGWVEPLPALYDGLTAYAERGSATLAALDPKDRLGALAYFKRLAELTRVLATIARHELAGRPLSIEEKRFLSMVVEMTPGGTGGPPRFTGWYFDLFRGREAEALTNAAFVADVATSAYTQRVLYAGASAPRMGAFVVDTGGRPRVMVGPMASGYELVGPLAARYTDQSVTEVAGKSARWAASYTAPTPAAAALAFAANLDGGGSEVPIVLRAKGALGAITIETLSHHRVPLSRAVRVVTNASLVQLKLPARGVEGIRVRVGDDSVEAFVSGPNTQLLVERGGATLLEADLAILDK